MAFSNIRTSARNAQCNGFVDDIDVGTTDTGGDLQIRTAGGTTLLGECEFSNPAFGAAAGGVATANAISDDASADATGTAATIRIVDRDNATVCDGTCTATSGGGDLELNTVSITASDVISITSGTITAPAA
ncbi:MAG: hypothetical protein AAF721_00410 [Myxococcota bacterium]